MSKIDDGGPVVGTPSVFGHHNDVTHQMGDYGLCVRDYFAAQVGTDAGHDRSFWEAFIERPRPDLWDAVAVMEWEAEIEAKIRYIKADAMLRQRSKEA